MHAQTAPGYEDPVTTIQRVGGPYAPCLTAIASRETGGTFDPYAVNPSSGAVGLFQFLPSGGEWQFCSWTEMNRNGYGASQ